MAGKTKKKKKSKPAARYHIQRGASAGTKRALAAKPKGPRSQTLPGMSKVRDGRLDQFCEDAGEGLDQINAGTSAVNDAKKAALQRMRDKGINRYVYAGVSFTLNEGVDSISVKRMKDKTAAGAVATQPSDAGTENDQVGDERRNAVEGLGGGEDEQLDDVAGAEIH